jgi:hypothetical protein
VGAEPDVLFVPDDVLPTIDRPVFGHLFGVRHHAIASIEKAERLLGFRPRYDARSGHAQTYDWFLAQGWADRTEPLRDPVWGASWDFDAEAELVARLR